MEARIVVNLDNAAFDGAPDVELARILEALAKEILQAIPFEGLLIPLRDVNGNRVGEFTLVTP